VIIITNVKLPHLGRFNAVTDQVVDKPK